jgi:hypothetical protein
MRSIPPLIIRVRSSIQQIPAGSIAACGMAWMFFGILFSHSCLGQSVRPGLSGMAPSKFIVIKHTQAPGRSFKTSSGSSVNYTQEDLYFKMWLPVFHKPNFYLLTAPSYRTEQLEFKKTNASEAGPISNWNLRSMGLDLRSCIRIDSVSWIIGSVNVNRSGNLSDVADHRIPFSVSAGAVFLKKKSRQKEIGYGFAMNKGYNRFTILPVLVFNYNFSEKSGIEISLPYKIAWRHNLSPKDILSIRAESSSRSYSLLNQENQLNIFRRTDVDFGVAYNKCITKYIGVEVSTAFRKNLSLEFPCDIAPATKSGMVFGIELYIRPPVK